MRDEEAGRAGYFHEGATPGFRGSLAYEKIRLQKWDISNRFSRLVYCPRRLNSLPNIFLKEKCWVRQTTPPETTINQPGKAIRNITIFLDVFFHRQGCPGNRALHPHENIRRCVLAYFDGLIGNYNSVEFMLFK